MPVKRGIFLTHGEVMAQATLRDHLVAHGCDANLIFTPRLDETVVLSLKGKVHSALTNPRLEDQAIITQDWQNEYAAFLVELSNALRGLPNDFSRHKALKNLQSFLEHGKKG
jgi:metallo-beta-lactamase family protein